MYQKDMERLYDFSDLMISAAKLHLLITCMVVTDENESVGFKSGWAGGPPEEPSRGPYYGTVKEAELRLTLNSDQEVSITPIGGEETSNYMGGMRRRFLCGYHLITTASAWSERCDALIAFLLSYAHSPGVRLHHVGFRHPSLKEMKEAIRVDQERLGTVPLEVPAKDHMRFYLRVESEDPNDVYWVEHQFFPKGKHTPAIHWDVMTVIPHNLLAFVGEYLEVKPTIWDSSGPKDPVGVIWEKNRDGVEYGIMSRSEWWEIG